MAATGALSGAASGATLGTAVMPGIGTAIGAVAGGLLGAFGGRQKAPQTIPWTPISSQLTQQQAIQGDISNQGDLETLLGNANTFQQQQATSMMNQALPGYSQFAQNLMAAGNNALKNQYNLPSSVVDQLRQQASEQNINVGATGQAGGYNWLRSLGINEVQYGQSQLQNAMSALTTAVGTAPRVSPMSPMSFYVTPQQQFQNQFANQEQEQAVAQGGANAAAAASNYNNQNLWSGISSAASGLFSNTANGGSLFSSIGSLFGGGGGSSGTPVSYLGMFGGSGGADEASMGAGAVAAL